MLFFFFFFLMIRPPPSSTLFPYTPLSRSRDAVRAHAQPRHGGCGVPYLVAAGAEVRNSASAVAGVGSEEHTSELQSPCKIVWRLLLLKKKKYLPVTRTHVLHYHGTLSLHQ